MGTVIGMFGSGAGGAENNLASIDCPANGNLIGVDWDVAAALDTTADSVIAELSFGSTGTPSINDTRSRISTCSAGQLTFATAVGAVVSMGQKYVALPDISVGMGERLYLHGAASATTTYSVRANLHFDFDLDKAQVRRR